MRAPSYKSIAIALLKNDMQLQSLGFAGQESEWYFELKRIHKIKHSAQRDIFYG
jgi:predicted phosphoadenosine phosphosulfate sulfurtransferase